MVISLCNGSRMGRTRGLAHELSSSDVDARTKETAATLIDGFAKAGIHGASGPHSHGSAAAASSPSRCSINNGAGTHSNGNNSRPHHHQQQLHHPHAPAPSPPASASSKPERPRSSSPSGPYKTVITSIGLGIDPDLKIESDEECDATEAAVKAVRDALERGVLRFPTEEQTDNLVLHVKLGIPAKREGHYEPMDVDPTRLTMLLPSTVPILPVEVEVGGLMITQEGTGTAMDTSDSGSSINAVCTAVACVTLQKATGQASSPANEHSSVASPNSVAAHSPVNHRRQSPVGPPKTWAEVERDNGSSAAAVTAATAATLSAGAKSSVLAAAAAAGAEGLPNGIGASLPSLLATATPNGLSAAHSNVSDTIYTAPTFRHEESKYVSKPKSREVHRSTSIEMLARISAEIHAQQAPHVYAASHVSLPQQNGGAATRALAIEDAVNAANVNNYNYKKLPPGVTPKNNKRLFVRHNYKDHSQEVPLPEELDLVAPTAPERTPNAAFPLKLHEILSQIEADGYDDIIGWLPHGRSFKIHKHSEFVETVLPKYFVMTKKSSFLRQLNLYGFNRLSGVGPDQGSYYHEKFLRGLKFLSRRMQRQKVNGNGIRAAGNPDEEPNLNSFPPCPPNNSRQVVGPQREVVVQEVQSHRIESYCNADPPDAMLRNSAGLQVSFPLKLQRILDKLEAEGNTDTISWLSHGRAFLVHEPDRFVLELMPVYFNQTKYSSFQRQLHMYNFQRITAGRDKGAYHHPNFQRGKPQLSLKMQRTRVNGKGTRRPGNPEAEPNLYEFDPLPPIPYGTKIEIPADLPHGGAGGMDDSVSGDES